MSLYQAKGDEKAFGTLVRRCEAMVFSYALRTLGSREDAEDAAQDVFMRLHSARSHYRSGAPFMPWLMTITVNICRDRLRRSRSRRAADTISLEQMPETTEQLDCTNPVAPLELIESREAVDRAIQSLPLHYREALVLRYTHSLSVPEVARILGISTGAAQTRLYRSRLLLRKLLREGDDHK